MPAPLLATVARLKAFELRLIVHSSGLHGNMLRILAPLTIPDEQLEEGLDILQLSIQRAMENG